MNADSTKLMKWIENVEKGTKILNTGKVMKWNSNKATYLKDLSDVGVKIIPSHFVIEGVEKPNLVELLQHKGWS